MSEESRKEMRDGAGSRLLVLGAGVMQGPALKIAAEMGFETIAVDGDPSAANAGLAARFEKIDLKDKEGIEALGRRLKENGGLAGIMTAGTDFSASAAWAAGKLSLPGISYETALDASDKERMRRRFKAAGVPSPEFVIVENPPKDEKLPFPLPVVVKPVDNMGSRGCRRVDNLSELKPALVDALRFSRSGRAIVEEYMEGPEFSVDALVFNGEITICGIADRHIFFPPYFIEMGHTMPSAEDGTVIKNLLETFCRGVKAIGIDNGAAKGDVKLTAKGPMIGEIAARLSGGYMSGWTYPYASGVLPTMGAIEIAVGKKPSRVKPEWNHTSAERAFISIPGKVRSVTGAEKAKTMLFVKDVFIRVKTGGDVNFPENNVSKCGNTISAAAAREDAARAAEDAARSILIRLETGNKATDAFLSARPGTVNFPPDAFAAGQNVLSRLDELPESKNPGHYLLPFPEFTGSGLKDYMGRTVEESLAAVRTLAGMELPFAERAGAESSFWGRSFWRAMIRGGYQGALYLIDSCQGVLYPAL